MYAVCECTYVHTLGEYEWIESFYVRSRVIAFWTLGAPLYSILTLYWGSHVTSLSLSCSDVDECFTPAAQQCTGGCLNSEGSFECTCPTGYMLMEDGATCTGGGSGGVRESTHIHILIPSKTLYQWCLLPNTLAHCWCFPNNSDTICTYSIRMHAYMYK